MRVTSEDGERDATSVAVEQLEPAAQVPLGVAVPRNFTEIVDGYRDPCILDFGCGYGRSLTTVLAAGLNVWGVDISGSQLSRRFPASYTHSLFSGSGR
jgi:SAM-dependent methyltransferase